MFLVEENVLDNVDDQNLPSKLVNSAARNLSGVELHDFNCGLKAYRKQVVKSVDVYGDFTTMDSVLAANAGFKRITENQFSIKPDLTELLNWDGKIYCGFLDLISRYGL